MLLGKNNEENGVSHCHSDGHNGACERLDIHRGFCDQQHENYAANHGRDRGQNHESQLHRLKISGEQHKNDQYGNQQPRAQTRQSLLHWRDLTSHRYFHATRKLSGPLDGFFNLAGNAPKIFSKRVGC